MPDRPNSSNSARRGRDAKIASESIQRLPKTAETRSITPELLTTAEAAGLLSIGERTLWRWSRSFICPAPIKIGTGLRPAVRYRRAELLAWLDSGCPRVDGRV